MSLSTIFNSYIIGKRFPLHSARRNHMRPVRRICETADTIWVTVKVNSISAGYAPDFIQDLQFHGPQTYQYRLLPNGALDISG